MTVPQNLCLHQNYPKVSLCQSRRICVCTVRIIPGYCCCSPWNCICDARIWPGYIAMAVPQDPCSASIEIIIIINPLTARVVGAPQMILQPVSFCPLGLAELQACPFPDVVFPPLPLSALSSSPFHCALQDGVGQT